MDIFSLWLGLSQEAGQSHSPLASVMVLWLPAAKHILECPVFNWALLVDMGLRVGGGMVVEFRVWFQVTGIHWALSSLVSLNSVGNTLLPT